MKRASAVWMALVVAALLAWNATPAQAAPTSSSQDPAQLSTAAVVFVKVDPKTGTDTILVFNRQQIDGVTSSGSSITIHVRFYGFDCSLKFDNNIPLTPQGFFAVFASSLFGITTPGVVLADFADSNPLAPTANTKFAVSAVVIDGNFGALYERQGSPLLQPHPSGTLELGGDPIKPFVVWGGFSYQALDDWFIGGFTMLQMICPGPDSDDAHVTDPHLTDDLNLVAHLGQDPDEDTDTLTNFADFFRVVNVYDTKEVLKRSIHNVPCFCNTDSAFFGPDSRFKGYPGDLADVITSMKAVGIGTFHWDSPSQDPFSAGGGDDASALIAWRVISTGGAAPVYWDARLRTTPCRPFQEVPTETPC